MRTDKKVAIIGGDARQEEVAVILGTHDFEIAVYGFEPRADVPHTKCRTFEDAVQSACAVLLPVPSFSKGASGGATVNGTAVRASALMQALPRGQRVVGGFFNDFIEQYQDTFRLYNVLASESFQIPNAVLTAESAIEIAIRKLPISLWNSNALVIGYGRIGKILAAALRELGAHVTVAARSADARALASANHITAADCAGHDLDLCLRRADVVFNTVPAQILTGERLLYASRCRLILDLASGDGGADFSAAERMEIPALHALGLPGKSAPVSAGRILAACVEDYFRKEGLMKS